MKSHGSTGPQRSISSVQMDGGPSTRAAFELGRKLAAEYEDHDLTGQWMAHHLSALITAAEFAEEVTVEQRVEIVDMILRVWGARRSSPGRSPGYELDHVFAALDMLGDDRPWKFTRLQSLASSLSPANDAESSLIMKAVSLESLTRQSVLSLIWLACEDAATRNESWLKAAEAAHKAAGEELTSTTRQVKRRLRGLTNNESQSPLTSSDENRVDPTVLSQNLRVMSQQLTELADQLDRDSAAGLA